MKKYNFQKITKIYSLISTLILNFSLLFFITDLVFTWHQQGWLTFLWFVLYFLTITSFFIISIIYACHKKLMYTNSEIPKKFDIKKYAIVSSIITALTIGLAIVITPFFIIYIIENWFFLFQIFLIEIGIAFLIFSFVLMYFFILYLFIKNAKN